MPILNKHTLDFVSHSPAQTRRFGARLGALLQAGDLICLEGELGAGKTCLAQGIGRGLGIRQPITSPTFTIINPGYFAAARLSLPRRTSIKSISGWITGNIGFFLEAARS